MFRWKPEGRYRHRLCTAILPFWFSTEHLWTSLTPFWLSVDDIWCTKGKTHNAIMYLSMVSFTIIMLLQVQEEKTKDNVKIPSAFCSGVSATSSIVFTLPVHDWSKIGENNRCRIIKWIPLGFMYPSLLVQGWVLGHPSDMPDYISELQPGFDRGIHHRNN